MSNEMSFTPATDFIGIGSTYDTTYTNFGVTAYQNRETLSGGGTVALSAHIAPCVEMGCGAHYYSHGIYNSTYRKAETTVNLSTITVDTKNRRVACISLGVIGGYGPCDMGIETFDGVNWFAHYWCGANGTGGNGQVVSGAAKVKITVEPTQTTSNDLVYGTFQWYNTAGTIIKSETLTCTARKNALFDVNSSGLTIQRFHRFMSLIPRDELGYSPQSDTADGSKLIGGNLTSNKLYLSNGSSVTWGTNLMDYIWSVQGWNISSFSPGNTDTFSCTHSNYVY